MVKKGLLNAEILKEIASLGHTEYLVVCDAGLPIPKGVKLIDISLMQGVPSFMDVCKCISELLVIDSIIVAKELESNNNAVYEKVNKLFCNIPKKSIAHQELKELTKSAKVIIRTGECTSFSNIIFVGGVNF